MAKQSTFAGYEKTQIAVETMSGSFTVPKIKCDGNKPQGLGIGIGDNRAGKNPVAAAMVTAECSKGKAVYRLVAVTTDQTDAGAGVGAGDKISVRIEPDGRATLARVRNLTKGGERVARGVNPVVSAFFGAFPAYAGGKLTPPANFGSVGIAAKLNGKALSGAKKVERVDGGKTVIGAGKLSKGKFKLTFKKS